MLLPTIVCLFIATANSMNTTTFNLLPPAFASNTTSSALLANASTSNVTIFAPLAAPLYHNVTAGDAWVFPSSANDLGARDMSCECFNPGDQCCMPTSSNVAPFCMPTGSICCGDTFCVAGESCCGDFCCAANTVCNVKAAGSGCCPTGAICSGPATCYDHTSSNCSNQAFPPQQCCPANIPFCRDFKPSGLGCYVSSTTASSTSSVPAMTAAGTSNIFAPSVSTSTRTRAIHTVTISVVSNGHGGVSLEFPTKSASVGSKSGETTYVLDWPASSATPVAVMTSSTSLEKTKTVGSSTATATTPSTSPSTPQSTAASSSTTPPPSSSTTPALCYDPNANSHSPCPTTTTSPSPSPSSSSGPFNPPGASIVKSQAPKLSLPSISLTPLRNFLSTTPLLHLYISLYLLLALSLLSFLTLRLLHNRSNLKLTPPNTNATRAALRSRGYDDAQIDTILAGLRPRPRDNDDKGVTRAEETETEIEKRDITVVKGSARPLLAPRRVVKGDIRVVEGSARLFGNGG